MMARTADPELRQWWRELIDSFDSTQETVGDFCRRHRVSATSFYGWRRKLAASPRRKPHARGESSHARAARRSTPSSPAFLPVQVVHATPINSQAVHVHLPEGVSIEVPAEQRELLFDLVARVRNASADRVRRHHADHITEVAS
jgi:transposase-like protein